MPMPTPQEWFSRDKTEEQQVHDPIPRGQGRIATPKTKEEFEALPDGTFYIEPDDGHVYQKGNKTRPLPKQPPKGIEV